MELEGKYGNLGDKIVAEHIGQIASHKEKGRFWPKLGQKLLSDLVNYQNDPEAFEPHRSLRFINNSFRLRDTMVGGRRMTADLAIISDCNLSVSGRDDWPTGLVAHRASITLELTDAESGAKSRHFLGEYERPENPESLSTGFFDERKARLTSDSDGYGFVVDALKEALEVAGVPVEGQISAGV